MRNDERGVELEVEGPGAALERFVEQLIWQAPPLARVERVCRELLTVRGESAFRIASSARCGRADTLVATDAATCEECLRELRDPLTAAIATRSSTAPTAGRTSRSCASVPYDRPSHDDGGLSDVQRLCS